MLSTVVLLHIASNRLNVPLLDAFSLLQEMGTVYAVLFQSRLEVVKLVQRSSRNTDNIVKRSLEVMAEGSAYPKFEVKSQAR